MAARRPTAPCLLQRTLLLLASACAVVLLLSRCISPSARAAQPATPSAGLAPWNGPLVSGKGFTIGPDVRVFAVFAYLNTMGGHDEEREPPMDPLRVRLRNDVSAALKTVDPARIARWKSFAAGHPAAVSAYAASAVTFGMPAEFRPGAARDQLLDPSSAAGLAGLDRVLSEFWRSAGLERLYRTSYREEIARRAVQDDPARISSQLESVHGYLRLTPEETARVSVAIIPNPFDSHSSRHAIRAARTLTILEGPGMGGERLDLREYLHYFVDPVVGKAAGVRSEVAQGLAAANRTKPLVKGIREDPAAFVSECLVRALDSRIEQAREGSRDPGLLDRLWQRMQKESEGGLTLVPFFFAELSRFEFDDGMSLATFVDSALTRLGK